MELAVTGEYSQVPMCPSFYFLPGVLVSPLRGHTLSGRELSKLSMAGNLLANLPIFLFVACATPNLIISLADWSSLVIHYQLLLILTVLLGMKLLRSFFEAEWTSSFRFLWFTILVELMRHLGWEEGWKHPQTKPPQAPPVLTWDLAVFHKQIYFIFHLLYPFNKFPES